MSSVEERNEVAIVAIRGIGSSSAYRPPERVEAAFCELRLYGVLRSSHWASVNGIIIAVEIGSPRFGVEAGGRRSSTCHSTWCSSLTPQMPGRLLLTLRRIAVLLSRAWQRPWALGWSPTI